MAVYGAGCLISALPRDSSCAACVGGAAAGIGIARGETRDRPFARGGERDLRRRCRPSSASTALSRPSSSSSRARSVSSCSSGSAGRFPFRADLSFSRVGLRLRDCWSANKSPDADWRREQLVPRIRQRWHPSSMSNSHLDFLLTHARPRQRVMSDEMKRTHRYMPR